ncbi:unnamed protein product, partial [Effrenium voratum]
EEVLDLEEGASSDDEGCDRFANMSAAKPDLSYRGHTVHFWTIPYSAIEGRLTAENTSKKGMLRRFREVYGEALEFYAVFRELHAESSRSWERKAHYHVVLKLKGRVRWIQIARELRARGIFGHLSLPTRYADIWRIVAYCYVPSARKPLPELDPDPLLSSNFPIIDMEKRLRGKLARTQVLRPWDFFQVLRRHPSIETYNDLIVWAQSQQKHGVPQYLEFMTRQGGKMSGLFKAWKQLMAKPVSQKSQREDKLISCWQDWRQNSCPVAWDTLLLLLDSQMKMCYRCVRCYSDWVDEKHAAYAEKAPDIEAETAALESAICQEDSRVPALQEEEEELSGATTQPLLAAQSADPRSSQLQPSGAAVRPQPAQLDELNPAEELKGDGSEPFQDRRVRPRLEPAVASSPAPAEEFPGPEEGNQPSQPLVPSHVEMLPAPRTPEPWTPPYPPPRTPPVVSRAVKGSGWVEVSPLHARRDLQ